MKETWADISKDKINLTSGLHQPPPHANELMIESVGERARNWGPFLQMKSRTGWCACFSGDLLSKVNKL